MASPRTTQTVAPRLVDVLRALPQRELDSLISRLGIRIDPAKRLDPPSQVARLLVSMPDVRDPGRLPQAAVELLHRLAEARGILTVRSLPPGLEPLFVRGMVFVRGGGDPFELILPVAHLLQLKSWEGEDPRGMRALLAQAAFDAQNAIASHYLGRPATPPVILGLEHAWESLGNADKLAAEVGKLAPTERRVLEGVEERGGEVETEELLELEREPIRMRTATGATPSRRGVGFSLERRGLLIPVHPNRHVIPTEVRRIIGAASHEERERRREQVRSFVLAGDHAPRRARFAYDPSWLAMGLALAMREGPSEVRPGIGTPKSLVTKLATRFGRDQEHVAMLIALSRAIGLWDPSSGSTVAPPGSLLVGELAAQLFSAWRRGGAWDEARKEPEMLRSAQDARDPSPVFGVREMVLEALRELGEGRWVPWPSLSHYFATDHRLAGLERLLRRWADRVTTEPVKPLDVAERIVLGTLPALGIVDLGEDDDGITLRLTGRGRSLLADRPVTIDPTQGPAYVDAHVLRIGLASRVGTVLAVAPFVEVGRASDSLDLLVLPQTLSRALSAGFETDVIRQRLEVLSPLPDPVSRTLAAASVVVGRGTYVAASGFLWIDDANLRELLRTRKATSELFVDPSPPAGLLIASGVDLERVARRCRTLGVEIVCEGQIVRARSIPPPAGRASSPPPKPA